MSNLEKYNEAFKEVFEVDENQLEGLTYQSIEAWDSVGHMGLVAALEEKFLIMMEMDDIIEFSSYEKGMELLAENYNIEFLGNCETSQ